MTLSYPALAAGLTNQKIALIGLIYKALRDNRPLVLPDFMAYHPNHGQHEACAFNRIYQTAPLEKVFAAFSVPHAPAATNPENIDGWQCFWEGADRWGEVGRAGCGAWPSLAAQIIRFLRPTPLLHELAETLYAKLCTLGIQHTLQLRIERDWQSYSTEVLPTFAPQTEDYNLPFADIVQKAKNTWGPEFKKAYVLCDEECLPTGKEAIREYTKTALGVELFWKSDFLPPSSLASNLISSILDFEIALKTPYFAGNSRSTFSCFVAFEKFCRTGKRPQNQYIYNLTGPQLGLRYDTGPLMVPNAATDSLYAFAPLIPPHPNDIRWPFSLTAHIATVGDISTLPPHLHATQAYGALCLDASGKAGRPIEGVQLDGTNYLPSLEYRVQDHAGQPSPWVPLGTFCGSRGQSLPLTGFAIRLRGPDSLLTNCLYAARFEGEPAVIMAQDGLWCRAQAGQKLLALQVLFRPA